MDQGRDLTGRVQLLAAQPVEGRIRRTDNDGAAFPEDTRSLQQGGGGVRKLVEAVPDEEAIQRAIGIRAFLECRLIGFVAPVIGTAGGIFTDVDPFNLPTPGSGNVQKATGVASNLD